MDSSAFLVIFALLGLAGIGSGSDSDDDDEVKQDDSGPDDSMVLIGTPEQDMLDGGDNNDLILGLEDDDTVTGGDGDDLINPGEGNDSVDGGDGDDVIVAALDLSDIVLKGETEPFVSEDADPDKILDVLDIDLADPPGLQELLTRAANIAVEEEISEEFDGDIVNGGDGDDEILIGTYDTATGGEGGDDYLIASIDANLLEMGQEIRAPIIEDEVVIEANPVPLITDFDPEEDTIVMEGTLDSFDRNDEAPREVTGLVFYDEEADETRIRIISNRLMAQGDDTAPDTDVVVQQDDASVVRLSGAFSPMDDLFVQFLDSNSGDILGVNLVFPAQRV